MYYLLKVRKFFIACFYVTLEENIILFNKKCLMKRKLRKKQYETNKKNIEKRIIVFFPLLLTFKLY